MPRLLLLRHAKAEQAGKDSARDFDRKLSDSGAHEAEAIGRRLAERRDAIDLVLCSSSARTRETWEAARKSLQQVPEPAFLRAIYDGQPSYLDILRREAGDAAAVLLIGHNPAIHETAVQLAADLSGPDGTALRPQFPTAALAVLEFDGPWLELAPGAARLTAFLLPRTAEDSGV